MINGESDNFKTFQYQGSIGRVVRAYVSRYRGMDYLINFYSPKHKARYEWFFHEYELILIKDLLLKDISYLF
jgi:hypothetical protein